MSKKERYNKVIMEVFQINDSVDIDENMTRDNNEKWDSLLHLTLVSAIEDEFDIMLETEDILALNSYKSGFDIINKNM